MARTTKTVKVDEDQYKEMEEIREEFGISISEQVRRAITEQLWKYKKMLERERKQP